jgi:cytoskeletal protein CcmA (bactofilin family)
MWKKNETQYPPTPEPHAATAHSPVEQLRERAIIGASIVLKGDVSGEEDLLIQGQVEGRVELKQHNVTIGKSGRVKADVLGKIISVEGEVHGNMYGEEKIVIRASGVLHGNIAAPRVILEEGAKFKGSIDMDSKVEKTAPKEVKPEGDLLKKAVAELPKKEEEIKKPVISYNKPDTTLPRP